MAAKNLFLIRHGMTHENSEKRYIGIKDVELSDEGKSQIRSLEDESIEADICWCSPLKRCKQSAEILFRKNIIYYKENLKEINFGHLENKTFIEIKERYSDFIDKWSDFDLSLQFPGGEKLKMFLDRVVTVFQEINQSRLDTLAIVTHGGVISFLMCLLLNQPIQNYLSFRISPGDFFFLKSDQDDNWLCEKNKTLIKGVL